MTNTTPTAHQENKPLRYLTTRHMEHAFGVSTMTLYLWRKGTATIKPLPVVMKPEIKGVAYDVKAVERWAKANGIEPRVADLRALLADEALKPRKDGRRPRLMLAPRKPSKREKAKREQ